MVRRFVLALLISLLASTFGSAQEAPSPETEDGVDPAVASLVSAWGERQGTLGDRRVRVSDVYDEVRPDGEKIQHAHVRTFTVSPPNRIRIETRGDRAHRTFVYDGHTATLADHDLEVYGRVEFEGTIAEMVDHLMAEYDLTTPLADFLSADPAATLMANVTEAEVIGAGLVGDTECIHIACRQDVIDWQAWFSGDRQSPQMLRMVITYKTLPLAPQYTLQNLGAEEIECTDEDFEFDAGGLEEIPFEPVGLIGSDSDEVG
jgi:hypothetical protein